MPDSPEIRITEFRWTHITAFSELLSRLGPHGFRSWSVDSEELRSELESMRLDPEVDIAVMWIEGRACGYVLALPEPDIDRIVVSVAAERDCKQHVTALIDFATGRAKTLGLSRIHVAVQGEPVEPVEQLLESGFRPVAANVKLSLDRADAGTIDDVSLPDGFTVRPMRSLAETLMLTGVQNRVFEDHWGFSKNTPEEIQARLDLPATGPEHVLFAESPEGDPAGYIWTALEWHDDHTCGLIWMTGVMPEFRSLGLGRAIVTAGTKHLLAQGAADVHLEVMDDNTAAVRIYEGMGFVPRGRTDWYEKKV